MQHRDLRLTGKDRTLPRAVISQGSKVQRATDSQSVKAFRTDRYFTSDGQWYFATREKVDFGPFRDRPDAYRALLRYLDTQRTMARLRGRDTVLDPDETFNEQGVATIAKEIRTWSDRKVGEIRGDEQRLDTQIDDF